MLFFQDAYTQGGFFRLPLSIQDSTGRTDTVQFGIDNLATKCIDTALGEEELPPDGCCNWFNILCIRFIDLPDGDPSNDCFGTGLRLDLRDYRQEDQVDTFRITFCGTPPWILRWPPQLDNWVDSAVIQDDFGGFFYRVDMMETDSVIVNLPAISSLTLVIARPNFLSSVTRDEASVPKDITLFQNYPNPFNSTTIFSFKVSKRSHVHLKVVDLLGREIAVLVNGYVDPGRQAVRFEAGELGSGIYFCRLTANGSTESRKFLIQR
jgi:hypothetical protein